MFSIQENQFIASLWSRLLNCGKYDNFFVFGDYEQLVLPQYITVHCIKSIKMDDEIEGQLIFSIVDSNNIDKYRYIENKLKDNNTMITISKEKQEGFQEVNIYGGYLYVKFIGYEFDNITNIIVPEAFKVLAIIHLYNEVDIIKKTVEYLLNQEISVYLIDNWSDDGSYEVIKELAYEYPERVFIERFPATEKTEYYEWYNQLERTEELSKKLNYNWFIHYDADEMRVSPWKNLNLRETIYRIDKLGYNLIENTVIDFKITDLDIDSSIFMKDTYFDFGHRKAHFEQTKTWKKTDSLELKKSGGHIATVDNPCVFPLKILNRHYPLRSINQARKKIFQDRKPRFVKENKERGWHGHYNYIFNEFDFIHKKENLMKWNNYTLDKYYIQLFTGCGIEVEKNDLDIFIEEYNIPLKSKVALYGAGKIGQFIYKKNCDKYNIECWVDKDYKKIPKMYCMRIDNPSCLKEVKADFIIIGIENIEISKEVKNMLIKMGIDEEKILWKPVKRQSI